MLNRVFEHTPYFFTFVDMDNTVRSIRGTIITLLFLLSYHLSAQKTKYKNEISVGTSLFFFDGQPIHFTQGIARLPQLNLSRKIGNKFSLSTHFRVYYRWYGFSLKSSSIGETYHRKFVDVSTLIGRSVFTSDLIQ